MLKETNWVVQEYYKYVPASVNIEAYYICKRCNKYKVFEKDKHLGNMVKHQTSVHSQYPNPKEEYKLYKQKFTIDKQMDDSAAEFNMRMYTQSKELLKDMALLDLALFKLDDPAIRALLSKHYGEVPCRNTGMKYMHKLADELEAKMLSTITTEQNAALVIDGFKYGDTHIWAVLYIIAGQPPRYIKTLSKPLPPNFGN
ncbi:Hypothetical_protein [Hexamita inflata]|uniref:Hypothetical_protein n=1 Tax=Hexamita inflata TaxID=28002 RepID=A0AA86VHF7_9EUKA|nr:Hypothetical protein HINF_LOCUS54423 [Hexamita inflata]